MDREFRERPSPAWPPFLLQGLATVQPRPKSRLGTGCPHMESCSCPHEKPAPCKTNEPWLGGKRVARDGEADWSSPVLAGERDGRRLVFGKQRGGDQSLTDRPG